MKATTGIFDASLGAQSNETSGRAILARQREGDVATFEYHDNLQRAIRYTGEILVDLIPKIYDTQRQIMIINDDESETKLVVNKEVVDKDTDETVILNDLSVGSYSVAVTVGPAYTTQRIEAANALTQLVQFMPILAQAAPDEIVKNFDAPNINAIVDRIRKMLPPALLEDEGQQPQGEQQQNPDQVKDILEIQNKQLMNQGKELDLKEKQIDIATKAGEIDAQLKQAIQQTVAEMLVRMSGAQQPMMGGAQPVVGEQAPTI